MTDKDRTQMRYNVLTWCAMNDEYTEQAGLDVPSLGVCIHGLRDALKELKRIGYSCHYVRQANGGHSDNDSAVYVERVLLRES